VEVHASARKHGIADEDTIHAAEQFMVAYQLDNDDGPRKELRLGPDRAGNLLEVVVLLAGRRPRADHSFDADATHVPGSAAMAGGVGR